MSGLDFFLVVYCTQLILDAKVECPVNANDLCKSGQPIKPGVRMNFATKLRSP